MGRKVSDKTLSAAAALLGRKGGSRNTEAQRKAHSEAVRLANAALTGKTPEETRALRRAAQMKVPAEKRSANASVAGKRRWSNREKPDMSNDEFRELVGAFTAKEIAEGVGVSYAKVLTWRRKANPIPIKNADAARIREWVAAQKKE